jgi:hypothetical protein
LSPSYIDCTPTYPNATNTTVLERVLLTSTKIPLNISSGGVKKVVVDGPVHKIQPQYNYSREYGRSILTDVRINSVYSKE